MTIRWGELSELRNKQQIQKRLKGMITASTYGVGPDKWTLTELINERSGPADMARRIIEGVGVDGKIDGQGPMTGADGSVFTVRLRVLTRQACFRDAGGKPINYWDVTDAGDGEDLEIFPACDDAPQPGDEVWVKGNAITHHPDTGSRLRKQDRIALHRRVEADLGYEVKPDIALFYWTKYPVGHDGCITVSYPHACQLLTTKGKRLVLPEFTTGSRKKKDAQVKRLISNWQFEEVAPGSEPGSEPVAAPVTATAAKRARSTRAEKQE